MLKERGPVAGWQCGSRAQRWMNVDPQEVRIPGCLKWSEGVGSLGENEQSTQAGVLKNSKGPKFQAEEELAQEMGRKRSQRLESPEQGCCVRQPRRITTRIGTAGLNAAQASRKMSKRGHWFSRHWAL